MLNDKIIFFFRARRYNPQNFIINIMTYDKIVTTCLNKLKVFVIVSHGILRKNIAVNSVQRMRMSIYIKKKKVT